MTGGKSGAGPIRRSLLSVKKAPREKPPSSIVGSYDAPEVACLSGERDAIVTRNTTTRFCWRQRSLRDTVFQQGRSALRGSPAKQRMLDVFLIVCIPSILQGRSAQRGFPGRSALRGSPKCSIDKVGHLLGAELLEIEFEKGDVDCYSVELPTIF